MGPIAPHAVDHGGHRRQAERGPGRDVAGPFHPWQEPEDESPVRGDSEGGVDQGETGFEAQEPFPRIPGRRRCDGSAPYRWWPQLPIDFL